MGAPGRLRPRSMEPRSLMVNSSGRPILGIQGSSSDEDPYSVAGSGSRDARRRNPISYLAGILLGWAVTWERGLLNSFLRVSLAFLGSREAAEQQCNSRKTVNKTSYPAHNFVLEISSESYCRAVPLNSGSISPPTIKITAKSVNEALWPLSFFFKVCDLLNVTECTGLH